MWDEEKYYFSERKHKLLFLEWVAYKGGEKWAK